MSEVCQHHTRGLPCEMCDLISAMGEKVTEAARQIKQLEPVIAYEKMRREYSKLQKEHVKCVGCGLCFGGNHLATPKLYIKELAGSVCGYCQQDIERRGLKEFLNRTKLASREDAQ